MREKEANHYKRFDDKLNDAMKKVVVLLSVSKVFQLI